MRVVRTVAQLREALDYMRQGGHTPVGFVPTMGYLHEGHASLLRKAGEKSNTVVMSIFVNPLQFGPNEDYASYPRDEARDLELAEREGADIVFIPSVEEMYPQPTLTKISVSSLTTRLCGASRPGHFDGVTTVVNKLFNMVQPDYAFFGLKDAQQVAVLRRMVSDLNMNVEIIACPIIRENDGLALSSRNVYLSAEERSQALVLSRSLKAVRQAMDEGAVRTADEARMLLVSEISSAPLAVIDYAEILTFPDLEALEPGSLLTSSGSEIIIALAVKFGRTRLIDNNVFIPKEAPALV
ncbi:MULTISPECIES: pantoate--beta-alanine ligase [unclassified Paenibacillus]|uniref:pantoate--beta-alanine ligase n=1 Tax=unclassified Paenibacillus TaxID=185978 RepID=UPI002406B3A8|nr:MULTISPECIES: pantoate--beta-alanine ligase [unclassified Paenibacillus]MDF9840285.1 pantoate--beta-alanine ligase [Paenibacillus sp. PastF-2]MDF9846867.1 pantoate--beta-alanine ligase [Paenibacillus sp. PastM-2]MDF9853439.1 pantoate--beta-alanine ligase [Paenibacillus sp. PastF-1]MDH6479074.1 pantoate--beta-alanine ligase [Paenibacillus sp. PastH-2]MDH6506806.1 pantoate--beta-alanine ligase [Paenibacillus sp. PastM-3]